MNGTNKSSQVKVLHVIDHMGMGGTQRVVSELLSKWHNENIKLFCYALRVSINNFNNTEEKIFCSSNHKSRYDIFSFFELKNFIEKENIKILHLHLAKSIMFGILIKTLFFRDVKIIVHEHGKIFKNIFWYNYFLKKSQSNVDLFIAVSDATKRMLIKNAKLKDDKIKTFYNFVDIKRFNQQKIGINRFEERAKSGLNKNDFVLGFAGRLNKIKGCDLLIRSIPYINIQNFQLLIAGDGPERTYLEKLTKEMNIENNVHFYGYIKNMISFYRLIDCFVFSSRSEASPMAFYEVQALGIPIIANDVMALNEFIKDEENGVLFKANDERDLAAKIELVYYNPELRAQMTIYGRENIKKYSIDNYIKNLYEIYENLSIHVGK